MTFGQLTGLVEGALGNWMIGDGRQPQILAAQIDAWTQQAIYRLDADLCYTQARSSVSVVAGTRRYTLATGILQVYYATYNGEELTRLTTIEEIARQELVSDEGTPTCFSWYGREIALYPTPESSLASGLEMWVLQTPAAMSGDSSTPTLPAHLHPLIVDYAIYQGLKYVNQLAQALDFLNVYEAQVKKEESNPVNFRGFERVRADSRVV